MICAAEAEALLLARRAHVIAIVAGLRVRQRPQRDARLSRAADITFEDSQAFPTRRTPQVRLISSTITARHAAADRIRFLCAERRFILYTRKGHMLTLRADDASQRSPAPAEISHGSTEAAVRRRHIRCFRRHCSPTGRRRRLTPALGFRRISRSTMRLLELTGHLFAFHFGRKRRAHHVAAEPHVDISFYFADATLAHFATPAFGGDFMIDYARAA